MDKIISVLFKIFVITLCAGLFGFSIYLFTTGDVYKMIPGFILVPTMLVIIPMLIMLAIESWDD